MACSICHDTGRIYEHVQDDTGKPCYSCQPPRPPMGSFIPRNHNLESDCMKDVVVECNMLIIGEQHPTEMYTLTAWRQDGRYVEFGITGENIKIFIMEDKIGLKDDTRISD